MGKQNCIVCGTECETTGPTDSKTIPALIGGCSGIVCRSTGNDGSSKYDVFHGDEFIEFIICDECLIKKSKLIQRLSFKEDETLAVRETFYAYNRRLHILANIRRTNGE